MRAKILLIACVIVTLSACGKREDPATLGQSGDYAAESAKVESAAAPSTPSVKQQLSSSANTYSDGERQFIRKADVKFRVKDVYQSALAIEDIVGNIGGFVEKNTIQSSVEREQTERIGDGKALKLTAYTLNGELTVRVPSAKTQEFLRLIAGQIVFLDQRSFTAQDAQFELLRQKLGIKRNQESQQQLGQIVQERGKIDDKADVIVAQNDSKGARDEAIVTEKEFADQVAFSEIKLALYQHTQVSQAEMPDVSGTFEMSSPGFFYRLGQAFKSGWHRGLETLIDLTKIWPFWLALIAGIAIVRKWRQRGKSTTQSE